jgi:HD-like signal output (HDOD) protein
VATVYRLALAAAIAQPLQQLRLKRRLMDAMWCKAIAGAVLASQLLDGHAASPIAFASGMLQEIGRLELHMRSPEDYAAMESLSGGELCAAERNRFGQSHANVGAALAEAWGLPPTVVEAIAVHHAAPEHVTASPAAQAVWLARLIGDADLGTLALPTLVHVQADPAQALAASQRESEALRALVGA